MVALGCALWLAGCGDDSEGTDSGMDDMHDAMHDGMHDHETCGLQEHCAADAVVLTDEVITIPSADKTYGVMIHEHDELTPNDDNEWMIMIMHEGKPAPNQAIRVNTFSEDCMHPGDKPVMELTTDNQGMVKIMPSFIHGGPWSVRVDPDASSTGEEWDDDNDVIIELCVPGKAHGE